ncbi:hypothetical protein [Sphingomonas crusticola]|uniref:hypothetical protein n=1 Tax=Sphingomonas crusticola TaxID=1697973 RepID=UPI0019686B12|nr:hypothetical protein [Sphingomonas crusticola]
MKRGVVLLALYGALISSGASAKKPQLSGLELQQIQARDFEASKNVAFAAVMTVLQDAGFRIGSADKDTGLITGIGTSERHMTWVPFVGFGSSKKNPVMTAFIEERGRSARVRLNFVMAKVKGNAYGNWSDEEAINDVAVYKDAFEKIEKEIFIRQAEDAPTAAVASVSPAPALTVSAAQMVTAVAPATPSSPPPPAPKPAPVAATAPAAAPTVAPAPAPVVTPAVVTQVASVSHTVSAPVASLPVYLGDVDRKYQIIGAVQVAANNINPNTPAGQAKIFGKLWDKAKALGADAVIHANIGEPHMTAMVAKKMDVTGVAVKFEGGPAAEMASRP